MEAGSWKGIYLTYLLLLLLKLPSTFRIDADAGRAARVGSPWIGTRLEGGSQLAIISRSGDRGYEDPAVRATIFAKDLLGLPLLEKPGRESTAYSTPIFLGHGSADEKVPCSLGEATAAILEKADYKVELKVYHGLGHWYKIPDEIDDIVEFLALVVGWKVLLSGNCETDDGHKSLSTTV